MQSEDNYIAKHFIMFYIYVFVEICLILKRGSYRLTQLYLHLTQLSLHHYFSH